MTPLERKDMPFLIGGFLLLIVFILAIVWYYS